MLQVGMRRLCVAHNTNVSALWRCGHRLVQHTPREQHSRSSYCTLGPGSHLQTQLLCASPQPQRVQHAALGSRLLCSAKKGGSSGPSSKKQPNIPASQEDDAEDADWDGVDDDDFGEDFDQEGEYGVGNPEDEDINSSPMIATGDVLWGQQALQACQEALQSESMQDLDLYSFRVMVARKRVDIRLDNLEDYYGSPTLDQVADFSRLFYAGLEAAVGIETAGEIDVEVSSPGAERELRVPDDLERFEELPMKVQFTLPESTEVEVKVLELESVDEAAATTTWRLADVKANSPGKGRKLSKKMREQRFEIPVAAIKKINLHLDY